MEHKGDGDNNCYSCTWNNTLRFVQRTGRYRNKMTSGGHPNYSLIKTGQNPEKSSRNLRRLTVTQTPMKDYQLMLV